MDDTDTPTADVGTLDLRFDATIEKSSAPGGWTYVVLPGSAELFGTRGRVKVLGTMDGQPFRSSFMALGDGRHKLPVKGSLLQAVGKGPGDTLAVQVDERLS